MAKAPRAKAPTPKPAPAAPIDASVTDQVNVVLETMAIEQLDATPAQASAPIADEAPASAPAPLDDTEMQWVEMTTGLSGPDLCLTPGKSHRFGAVEAKRLVDAGFANYTDAPAA